MEPYQKASEALRSGEEYPLQILKNVGLTALGGGAASVGSKALKQLMPAVGALINNYVPENIAMKGLNKIDPRFGNFIQGALDEGYSFDDLRSFIGEKVQKTQQGVKENKNIISQYDDQLHAFMDNLIKNGRSALEAGALARATGKFNKAIKKMEKDHKTNFSSIIEAVYGKEQPQAKQSAPQQTQQIAEQAQPNPAQSPSSAPNNGDAALIAALQKILSM